MEAQAVDAQIQLVEELLGALSEIAEVPTVDAMYLLTSALARRTRAAPGSSGRGEGEIELDKPDVHTQLGSARPLSPASAAF